MVTFIDSLHCPYCTTPLRKTDFSLSNGFFSYRCECDEFPVIFDILYLKKDDFQTHKKILELLKLGQKMKAFQAALIGTAKTHQFIISLAYSLKHSYGILFERTVLLKMLLVLGPARSWFSYLLKSRDRNTLQTAVQVYKDQLLSKKPSYILDVGAGIGFFSEKVRPTDAYVGIDKSFLSMAIAQLYSANKNCLYICGEVESGLPFASNFFHQIIFLDTFAWILNKHFLIKESSRTLQNNGKFIMVNVHEMTPATYWWGYPIQAETIFSFLKRNHFTTITFFENTLIANKLHFMTKKEVDPSGYSLLATKA